MIYTNIHLNKNNSLAFLARPTASFVDHYVSSQPLNLFIPYTEYVALIEELVLHDLDVLRNPIAVYRDTLESGIESTKMCRLYSLDIALSGMTELSKSYKMGFPCTRIFGCIDTETELSKTTIDFSSAPEFVAKNFAGDEMMKIHNSMKDKYPILGGLPTNPNLCTSNLKMYYMCMLQMGVFLLGKKFVINIEEEE